MQKLDRGLYVSTDNTHYSNHSFISVINRYVSFYQKTDILYKVFFLSF